jgi:H+/gluconate symporter-like permease
MNCLSGDLVRAPGGLLRCGEHRRGAFRARHASISGAALRRLTRALGTRHAILAVVIACALLTYGGISLFVVASVVVPVAAALFRRAEIPHRLIPAPIAAAEIAEDGLLRERVSTSDVVTLLAIAGVGHRESYRDIAVVMLGGTLIALVAIISIRLFFGTF